MIKELGNKYKNITRNDIETFLHFCEPCQQKQKGSKKGVVVKPIISSDFNSRCQVDLIDFQSHPDGKFKFIMVYQDHLTKFVVLKPLEFKRAEEVAYNIIDIFTLLGATTIKLNNENANVMRTRAKENLENQAKKMMAWSNKKLLPVAIHSTVRVPVPEVDKGRLDARSILAIVLEVTSDSFYRLGTRDGVLKQLYARSQFTACQKKLLQIDEVPIDTEVALRTVAKEQSTGTGQGFLKCVCKTKCQNKKVHLS
ncbi:SCAN domain-containing protein 3-like [Aphis gossypii]|uniref:SCAN domain-containing protein 3-like n=1 Tax=Aphis gossypii TaxID=80765 RepID=UPI002159750B|nr:SCAN domain-containing protein 3-like [Aphis gossypii]XP_050058505.1 SCAN domain-containing protein 3-like [Aphis gossypii]